MENSVKHLDLVNDGKGNVHFEFIVADNDGKEWVVQQEFNPLFLEALRVWYDKLSEFASYHPLLEVTEELLVFSAALSEHSLTSKDETERKLFQKLNDVVCSLGFYRDSKKEGKTLEDYKDMMPQEAYEIFKSNLG
jgi:hypothetical protein